MPAPNPTALIETLAHAPSIVAQMMQEMKPEYRKRRPQPGKWSAHEHACHLQTIHPLFNMRLDLLLGDKRARITPYNPDKDEEEGGLLKLDLDTEMKRFAEDRAKLVARLRKLTPAQWANEADHPEYSRYSVYIMFRHLTLHDHLHAYRIEELLLKRDW